MPVLLLCRGDNEAKNTLRGAIEKRYGINPPAIDDLVIVFKGRSRLKLGPVKGWMPFEATSSFIFPTHLRWDYTVKPMGLPVRRGLETFDGEFFHSTRDYKNAANLSEEVLLETARKRLWSIAAMLLTPLSEMYIELATVSDNVITATNTQLNETVELHMREDGSLQSTHVTCVNPESGKRQNMVHRSSEEQIMIDGLMLPAKVDIYWDDDLSVEMKSSRANMHPQLEERIFSQELSQTAKTGSL